MRWIGDVARSQVRVTYVFHEISWQGSNPGVRQSQARSMVVDAVMVMVMLMVMVMVQY